VTLSRRDVLKSIGTGAAVAAAGPATLQASSRNPQAPADAVGMLYDATVCIGCKACVAACTTANGLIPDTTLSGGIWQMPTDLNAQTKNIIMLARDGDQTSFVKKQCMHCIDPACVSGCPFGSLEKGKYGMVEWDPYKCIGCRYCEISCPFDVPRFEWAKFNPKIVKCEFCNFRLEEGKQPACTEACPVGAVIFGTRAQLLAEAKKRIADNPGKYYQDRVYGEGDLGGTQVLYLSHMPFEKLGLPEVGNESRAHYGSKVHNVLYKGMAIPVAVYAVLVAAIKRRYKVMEEEARREASQTGRPEQL
jgi:Fe-S-cluster-containing dehydrogenase component